MNEPVVVDKSFIQGHKAEVIRRFASQHRILMTEALFFEILSNPQDRRACFAKLPPGDNPVDLVLHSGAFIQKEISTRRPVSQPSKSIEKLRFKFNEMLLDKEYCVPTEVQAVLSEQRQQVREDAETFKERALLMQSFFPDLAAKKSHARLAARIAVEEFIVEPGSLVGYKSTSCFALIFIFDLDQG